MTATRPRRFAVPIGVDPVSVGTCFGLLAGLLAIGLPFFTGLTMALAALVAVTWATHPLRSDAPARSRRWGAAAIVLGWGAFLLLPAPVGVVRAALLGASLLPLWWTGGRAAPFGGSVGT
ncbi:MAG: hypothetical protein ACREDK_07125 [Thermoplasmata archaeon]